MHLGGFAAALKKKIYIIGEAKSCLDLRGGKERSLRADVERLARGVSELSGEGKPCAAYLVVLTEQVANRARRWCTGLGVEVLLAELSGAELEEVLAEKRRNAEGLSSGDADDSTAHIARQLAEQALTFEIQQRHPGVQASHESAPLKNRRWDFFGVTED